MRIFNFTMLVGMITFLFLGFQNPLSAQDAESDSNSIKLIRPSGNLYLTDTKLLVKPFNIEFALNAFGYPAKEVVLINPPAKPSGSSLDQYKSKEPYRIIFDYSGATYLLVDFLSSAL